ncbi:MAG: hypothetical protein AAGF32_07950 [Pseudomonadota bacterium]
MRDETNTCDTFVEAVRDFVVALDEISKPSGFGCPHKDLLAAVCRALLADHDAEQAAFETPTVSKLC